MKFAAAVKWFVPAPYRTAGIPKKYLRIWSETVCTFTVMAKEKAAPVVAGPKRQGSVPNTPNIAKT